MYSLLKLAEKLPSINQARMISSGFGIWMVWTGELSSAILQTMQDHGGIQVVRDSNQGLWFFFSKDAFRALARLQLWAKLNPLSLFIQVIPSTFLVGFDMNYSVSISSDLRQQFIKNAGEFEVLVHPKLEEPVNTIPGLSLRKTSAMTGLASVEWTQLTADQNFAYETSLGWYFIVKPLGKTMDSEFNTGWRDFFQRAKPVLERMGLKYIYKDSFLIFPLENLRLLRNWCREILLLMRDFREDEEGNYWPCVMAAVPKKGLNFTENLPGRVNLEWNRLTPDYPHMSYRDGYLLGEDFRINEIGYSMDKHSIDDWCHVSLVQEAEQTAGDGSTQVSLPRSIISGEKECFYCGLKNHGSSDCPSHMFTGPTPDVWDNLASIAMNDFNSVSGELDKVLEKDPVEGFKRALAGSDKPAVLAKAIMEINLPCQLRTLRLVWRSRSKDWHNAFDQLAPEEGEYIWAAMTNVHDGNVVEADNLLRQATIRYPRSYQPRSLNALLCIEQEDPNQALFYIQEANRLSYTSVQKSLFFMLEGRLHETTGGHDKAVSFYKQAEAQSRVWLEPVYRQGVCMVKMGFTDHALGLFKSLIERDPHFFNRILIDPELERGRYQVQTALGKIWSVAKSEGEDARKQLESLIIKIKKWFNPDHDFTRSVESRIKTLKHYAEVENYVNYQRLLAGCESLSKEFEDRIKNEVANLGKRVEFYFDRLKEVMREASWFPFPRLLRDFNKDFNFCVDKLNWMNTRYMKTADNFRKGQAYITEIDERMKKLQRRLVTLRIVRDAALFVLLLGRNFIWMELIGLGLALVLVPVIIYLAQSADLATDLLLKQKWQLQKGLILILSIVAMSAAVLRTAITFERKKAKIFDEEYDKMNKARKARKAVKAQQKQVKGGRVARGAKAGGGPSGNGKKAAGAKKVSAAAPKAQPKRQTASGRR